MLDGTRTVGTTPVAHEAGGLVVPLAIEEIERVLQRGRDAVVVLGRHKDVPVERRDLLGPRSCVRLRVLP
jgi:hypothetical protein